MIPIFLIHDPQRKDRRDLFRKEFQDQGIDMYTLVPADKSTNDPIRNIARVHKKCIRMAIEANHPEIVIMEDDVKFACTGSYSEFLKLYEIHGKDCDIFTSGSYSYNATPREKDAEYLQVLKLRNFSGLHCYIVKAKVYELMLRLSETTNYDRSIESRKFNILMTYPMMALQHDGMSDNVKKVTNYNTVYKDKIKLWNCER